jgi:osmotically-inducible protein OsmY
MSDPTLQRDVLAALADTVFVHPDEISVHADGSGNVTLRGTVGSLVQQAQAMSTARAVGGVRSVVDELQVRLLDSGGKADADTEAVVLDALLGDDDIATEGLEVQSHGGAVTLHGSVGLASERDTAERIALAVPGVQSVENNLGVRRVVMADDVARRVTRAILGGDRISVEVHDNDVTLTGSISSPAHRDAAVTAAAGAPGVATVRDKLVMHPHAD